MSANPTPPGVSPDPAAQDKNVASPNAGTDGTLPANPTAEQMAAIVAENEALKGRVQAQSGLLGQHNTALKSLQATVEGLQAVKGSVPPLPDKDNVTPPIANGDPVLSQRVKDLEARESRHLSTAKFTEIQSALLKAGIPDANVKAVSRIFDIEMGERLETSVGDFGDFEIGIREAPETLTPLSSYVGAWLQTESGRSFIPATKNPSTVGIPRGKAPPPSGLVEYTRQDVMNGTEPKEAIRNGTAICIDF